MTRHVFSRVMADESAARAYESAHANMPAALRRKIAETGIEELQIYRVGMSIVMLVGVEAGSTLEKCRRPLLADPLYVEWQLTLPTEGMDDRSSRADGPWLSMEEIFDLADTSVAVTPTTQRSNLG